MIDVKELRINSTVWYNDKRVKITAIDNTDEVQFVKTSFRDDKWLNAKLIDPVPLTPELVEELGFEMCEVHSDNTEKYLSNSRPLKGWYQDPKCKEFVQECLKDPELAKGFSEQNFCSLFHYENEEKQEIWQLICAEGNVYVSYLHELENMYHYLTGREL